VDRRVFTAEPSATVDALALRLSTGGTTSATRCMEGTDGVNFIVADDPDSFALAPL
jgi:hypothetical protein